MATHLFLFIHIFYKHIQPSFFLKKSCYLFHKKLWCFNNKEKIHIKIMLHIETMCDTENYLVATKKILLHPKERPA